jgi:hypothetical protein
MKENYLNVCCPHCKRYTTLFQDEVETGIITQRVTITGFNPNSFEFEYKIKVTDIDFYNPVRSRITTAKCKRCGNNVDLEPIRQGYINVDVDRRAAEEAEREKRNAIGLGDIVSLIDLEAYLGDVTVTEIP